METSNDKMQENYSVMLNTFLSIDNALKGMKETIFNVEAENTASAGKRVFLTLDNYAKGVIVSTVDEKQKYVVIDKEDTSNDTIIYMIDLTNSFSEWQMTKATIQKRTLKQIRNMGLTIKG